jgi:Fic-DOC domain mobile mystery protein B
MAIAEAHAPGATPLDPDEAVGLKASHIRTQGELDQWEQANILKATTWLARARKRDILHDAFVRELHRRMFDETWNWAGRFRKTGKNIGVDPREVSVKLRELLDDARYWLEHRTYSLDEIGVRFHHRLVLIHPFANGNGRHARLMTDLLLQRNGADHFSWGADDIVHASEARARYISALRAADGGDYQPLLTFVRS